MNRAEANGLIAIEQRKNSETQHIPSSTTTNTPVTNTNNNNENIVPTHSSKEDTTTFFSLVNSFKNQLNKRRHCNLQKHESEKNVTTVAEENLANKSPFRTNSTPYVSSRALNSKVAALNIGYIQIERQKRDYGASPNSAQSLMIPDESSLNCMKSFMKDLKKTMNPSDPAKLQHVIMKLEPGSGTTRNLRSGIEEAFCLQARPTFTPRNSDLSCCKKAGSTLAYRKASVLSLYHIREEGSVKRESPKAEDAETTMNPLAARLANRKVTVQIEPTHHSANPHQSFTAVPTPRQQPLNQTESHLDMTEAMLHSTKFKISKKHVCIKDAGRHTIHGASDSHTKDLRIIKSKGSSNNANSNKDTQDIEQSGGDNKAQQTQVNNYTDELILNVSLSKINFEATKKRLHILDTEMMSLFPLIKSNPIIVPPRFAVPGVMILLPTVSMIV